MVSAGRKLRPRSEARRRGTCSQNSSKYSVSARREESRQEG